MKFETSDKTSLFSVKPHVEKGYYPAKLLAVEEFKEKSGAPKIGKFGQQLIFEFAVYEKDLNSKAPVKPMMFKPDKDALELYPVRLSKFVYHKYKKTDRNDNWINGDFTTAITPKSAITKVLQALGWTFSGKGVDIDDFIGNWVELNIDDYTYGEGNEAYKASTIQNVNPYEGPAVGDVEDVKPSKKPQSVEKQIIPTETEKVETDTSETDDEIKRREDNIEKLKTLYADGSLSESGMNQSIESLKAEIETLKKK